MSEVKVNKISPRSGTNVQLGDSGDTITVPSGATLDASNATTTLPANVVTTTGSQTLTNKTINSANNTITITEANISDLGSYITASSTDTLTNKTIGSSQLTGALPALDGSALTGIPDTIAPTRHSIRPSLNLDFANSKALDPRITFTRASNATYYDGYTSVKAEENLFTYSQEIEQWTKSTNITVTANSTTAPDGTLTADTIEGNTTSSGTRWVVNGSSHTGNATYSFYAKAGTNNYVQIYFNVGGVYANFDLSTGAVGSSSGLTPSIVDAGNGWYRCIVSDLIDTYYTSFIQLIPNSSSARASASTLQTSIYLWGGQKEIRSSVTTYTPTTSSPITKYQPALQTAGNNVARFDHNPATGESLGLLIEESRTNLVTYSEDLVSSFTVGASFANILSNTIIAPDGTLTGSKLYNSTTTGEHYREDQFSYSAGSYSFSVYAKAGEYNQIIIRPVHVGANEANSTTIIFTLTGNGSFNTTPAYGSCSIDNVGNGWYRCVVNLDLTGTVTSFGHRIQLYNGSTSYYTGDGYSGVYVWGAQAEAGSFPTSYIKTTGSQVTRSADSASMTGTNFSDWYRQDNGSVYVDGNIGSGNFPYAFYIGDGTTNNRHILYRVSGNATSNTNFGALTTANGTTQVSLTGLDAVAKKFVYSYTTDNFSAVANGGTVIVDNYGILPTADRLWIGSYNNSSFFANGTIKKLSYYPIKLTNNEIIDLTEE